MSENCLVRRHEPFVHRFDRAPPASVHDRPPGKPARPCRHRRQARTARPKGGGQQRPKDERRTQAPGAAGGGTRGERPSGTLQPSEFRLSNPRFSCHPARLAASSSARTTMASDGQGTARRRGARRWPGRFNHFNLSLPPKSIRHSCKHHPQSRNPPRLSAYQVLLGAMLSFLLAWLELKCQLHL